MKKWIPKDLCYCLSCKWRSINKNKEYQMNGYCQYLKKGDWENGLFSLIWDGCKECGEHDGLKIEELEMTRIAKWRARHTKF